MSCFFSFNRCLGLQAECVYTCHPDDMKTLFRNDAKYPIRPILQFLDICRNRNGMHGGLVTSQGKEWHQVSKPIVKIRKYHYLV